MVMEWPACRLVFSRHYPSGQFLTGTTVSTPATIPGSKVTDDI